MSFMEDFTEDGIKFVNKRAILLEDNTEYEVVSFLNKYGREIMYYLRGPGWTPKSKIRLIKEKKKARSRKSTSI